MMSEIVAGKTFAVYGKVVHGEGRGKKIGFPTANIDANASWLETGVYGVTLLIKEARYYGVMNIGNKPTFHQTSQKNIEIHIFDFNESIYGESIHAEALFKIRNEQKFNSVEELRSQIKGDVAAATFLFDNRGKNYGSYK
jgi:riboflavin kinase